MVETGSKILQKCINIQSVWKTGKGNHPSNQFCQRFVFLSRLLTLFWLTGRQKYYLDIPAGGNLVTVWRSVWKNHSSGAKHRWFVITMSVGFLFLHFHGFQMRMAMNGMAMQSPKRSADRQATRCQQIAFRSKLIFVRNFLRIVVLLYQWLLSFENLKSENVTSFYRV